MLGVLLGLGLMAYIEIIFEIKPRLNKLELVQENLVNVIENSK